MVALSPSHITGLDTVGVVGRIFIVTVFDKVFEQTFISVPVTV